MCGRLDQNDINRLIQNFGCAEEAFNRSQADGKYNVWPRTYRPVLHLDGGVLFVDDLHWGYRSAWAEASGQIPMAINTRLEKITNRYWKPLLKKGRAIVPAAGWYEWTGEKGSQRPWRIHRKDDGGLYLAALANFWPPSESKTANGFTIVTADAAGGMVDVQIPRPVVLTPQDAALGLDPSLVPEQAKLLLRSMALDDHSRPSSTEHDAARRRNALPIRGQKLEPKWATAIGVAQVF